MYFYKKRDFLSFCRFLFLSIKYRKDPNLLSLLRQSRFTDVHMSYNSHMYNVSNCIYITYYLGTVLSTILNITNYRSHEICISYQHTNIPTRVTSPPNFLRNSPVLANVHIYRSHIIILIVQAIYFGMNYNVSRISIMIRSWSSAPRVDIVILDTSLGSLEFT